METEKPLLKWAGIFIGFAIFSVCGIGVFGSEGRLNASIEKRADVVTIDALTAFGNLERPKVIFLHDKHTEALEKKSKDCTTCHKPENDRLSLKFMRLKDTNKREVMDIYHTHCIACHQETSSAGENSGPVTCGECHQKDVSVLSARETLGLDKSLHFRHSKANEKKCERCHHEYDETTQKLFYAKGKEGTCRYCHEKETEEKRISYRMASHLACIDCHRKTLARHEIAGPVLCKGCHDPHEQKMIEKVDSVPRMEMKQPDIVFIKSSTRKPDVNPAGPGQDIRMNRVPFNHQEHEAYNDTCRVCHHANLKSCAECHTKTGTKEGKNIKLAQAMHQLDSPTSCMGCHATRKQDKKCAGCHAFIETTRKGDDASCLNCHMTPLLESTPATHPTGKEMSAATLLESRTRLTGTFDDEDIPETVVIKELIDQYEAVELPHRKIVHALVKNIEDSKLANYFHGGEGTVCQGCHHNSPAAKKPPQCGSCHGKPFDKQNPGRPGLMGAYHAQCMGCHTEMGIAKPVSTDCTACHKERKRSQSAQ